MLAMTRVDGIFKNPHMVEKFVEEKVRAVKLVMITIREWSEWVVYLFLGLKTLNI